MVNMDTLTNSGTLLPAILSSAGILGLLSTLIGFIIKNNGEIKTLKSEKISKKEAEKMIQDKLKIQYDDLVKDIGFITKCIVAIAKELKITTPLE
jgi:hypothetical protein